MKADIAIITAREDELGAMLVRLKQYQLGEPFTGDSGRTYAVFSVPTRSDKACAVALARCSEQGNDVSQQVAADMIRDFDPQLLLVTGIAGGIPHNEFTLGDVIISSRIHNFNLSASNQRVLAFDVKGGIHPYVSNITANLLIYKNALAGWNEPDSIGMARPVVDLAWVQDNLYGNEKWRKDVLDSFSQQFGEPASQARLPLFKTGSIASSNTLMKDTRIPTKWLETTRSILAVEMESAGVLQAAQQVHKQYPVMAIRAISDIIGLKRDDRWTPYAAQSAAAFTCAFIKAGIVAPREQLSNPPAPEETTSGTAQGSGTSVDPPANPSKNGEPAPLNLFISYAASDERFKRELDNHLALLRRSNMIRSFEMEAGQEWEKEASERISQSQIILLLISTDFLNSNDLYDNELEQAMSRHRAKAARVIPILIRPASTDDTPFSKLRPLPLNRRPVELWRNHDEAWVKIVQEIRKVCKTLREGQQQQ